MNSEQTRPAARLDDIVTRLVNDEGGTYFIKIGITDEAEATEFLQEMWKAVDPQMFPNETQALQEWTDRGRAIRSTFNSYDGICIRTHAWHPTGDERTLDDAVLVFIRERGFDV